MTDLPFSASIDKLGGGGRRIEELIRAAVPEVAPALAVSVWRAGSPWYEAYAGVIDPETETGRVGFHTCFDLASLTKVFTATAVLRLANDLRLDLDAPVVDVIGELGDDAPRAIDGGQEPLSRRMLPVDDALAGATADSGAVTFRQLLTHTGGLAPWRSVFERTGPVPPPPTEADPTPPTERTAAGVEAVCGYPFVGRPGEACHYSDLGFILLGEAVRRTFGTPLDGALQALIRDRLGLDSLTFRPLRVGRARSDIAPTSFDGDWRGRRCHGEAEDENAAALGGIAGHAGLFATVHDVARFGVAWLRTDPRLRLERFFRQAVTDQSGIGAGRGLGWRVQPADFLAPLGDGAYGHTGFTGTSLAVDPDRDLVVALLTNRVYAGRSHEGIGELRQRLHALVADLA